MKVKRLIHSLALIYISLSCLSSADERRWPLDQPTASDLSVMGGLVKAAPGVRAQALVFDGTSLIQVTNSAAVTHHAQGFTFAAWVNPYAPGDDQQMIAAKNRYALNEREWGVMIDKDGRYRLYVKQAGWRTLESPIVPTKGLWQQVAVAISSETASLWINGQAAGRITLNQPIPKTRAPLTFGGVNDNGRIWQNLHGALDEVLLIDRALTQDEITALYLQDQARAAAAQIHSPPPAKVYPLWSGRPIPDNPEEISFAEGMTHQTIYDARQHDYKFLHGAAIIHYHGTFFVHWANSPKNENQQFETLQGRRSNDGGVSWSEVEIIGPGFKGLDRHSHGVFLHHQGKLWTFAARFGLGPKARRFPGLCAEAFVLNEQTGGWDSKGKVLKNCWPYDEPVKMDNGHYITGGQDKDGLPVVAISHGDDVTQWESVPIPCPAKLQPSYAETTVWAEGKRVTAIIRGGRGIAWVATSEDHGRTWSTAQPSNLPMPRAKAYFGKLSTGQLYLVSNLKNRDTLVISVGRPGESSLSSMWRLRHGKSEPPRFPGAAKSKQWSYPYVHEHADRLYVVYSIGKEDCGLTIVPVSSLQAK